MSDVFSKEKRSEVMKAVKSKNTKTTELKLIKIFKECSYEKKQTTCRYYLLNLDNVFDFCCWMQQ